MSLEMSLDIQGGAELERALLRLEKGAAAKTMRQALRAGAKIIQTAAKAAAPVRTGEVKRNIKVRAGKRKRGVTRMLVGLGDRFYSGPQFYGSFLEFGHFHGKRKGGKRTRQQANGRRWIEGKHFLQQASEQNAARAVNEVVRVIREKLGLR